MTNPLNALLDVLDEPDTAAVRSWLSRGPDGRSSLDPLALRRDHEKVSYRPPRPDPDDPKGIRSVGVIGGGTAGYLAALMLKAKRPWLDVTIVESSAIPVIGVGEATVPSIIPFLHHILGIDPSDFYERVRPTWKLGIKFEWGPDPEGFMAPFDWGSHSVGILGSLAAENNISAFTLESLLMRANRTPVFGGASEPISLMKYLPFAYHLDNQSFVAYLASLSKQRGIGYLDAELADVVLSGPEWVDHLHTKDGHQLRFDFYVDCTGFRSLLLGRSLETPFHSYADSLFTDSAVTGNLDHGGFLEPYTTATTMNAGWCWNIPTPDSDHLGYVYCSSAINDEEAALEMSERFPGITAPHFIKFRVGRHEQAWRGNVMAIGNAYAFVEPLESTALLMITMSVAMLANVLPASWSGTACREMVNKGVAQKWDALRWFLALHYRFNSRLDTPFWQEARSRTDVSGCRALLDVYHDGAPLRLRDTVTRTLLEPSAPPFYWLSGIDCVLLGQKVPSRLLSTSESPDRWQLRKRAADAVVERALPQREALAIFRSEQRLNKELLLDPDSWASLHDNTTRPG